MEKAILDRKSFIINFIYFGIIVGLYYFIVKYAFGYVFPFVFAAVLAVFLQTPIRFISKKLNIKAHGFISTLMVLLIVVLSVCALFFAVSAIFDELKELVLYLTSRFKSVDDVVAVVEEAARNFALRLPKGIGATLGLKIDEFFSDFSLAELSIDASMLSTPISGAWGFVKGLPSFVVSILVTIISCFFMTSEYDIIRDTILEILPAEKGKRLVKAKGTVTKGIGKLVKAYITIMLITFTEVFLGLTLMKVIGVYDGGYIPVIAFVVCIVDIIPVLGTGTVVIPWAIYSLFVGNIGTGIGLILLYVVITVLRQVLEPKLVARQAGLPSIVTIMAMFLGARVFGAFGILLLPLTVIVVKLMYDEGVIGIKSHAVEVKENE
jgi:sporulation integral membrane protein YtvI